MFTIAQHIRKMETTKNTFRLLLLVLIAGFLYSCSSTSSLPSDDIYYSSKNTKTPGTYNYDDYKNSAENLGQNNVSAQQNTETDQVSGGYYSEYTENADAATEVSGGDSDDYEFIDEYYDSDYAARIKRFNGDGVSNDYYSSEYTDDYCNCGSGSNVSFSFGIGAGYGWSMGYSYGWPYYWDYPYYSWGYYPYWRYPWGYPYYGGSYWAGYNNGYWNGYWDGYYNGGGYYPGGYYPEYGNTIAYRPRGRGAGGGTIPRSRGGRSSDVGSKTGSTGNNETVVARGGVSPRGDATERKYRTTSNDVSDGTSIRPRSEVTSNNSTGNSNVGRTTREYSKPSTDAQENRNVNRGDYQKPSQSTDRNTPKYNKPKSYESLPSRQPRSSKEYVRPSTNNTTNVRSGNTSNNTNRRSYNPSTGNNTRTSVKQNNTNTNRTAKSYTTPSRSNTSKSYSAPSRSSNTRSYSSPSRSSSSYSGGSSGTRSSGSSSRSSSSSSSSRSGGGRR